MISFRLLGNTGALADKIRKLERQIDTFKTEILNEAAGVLVTQSPVDTGTYMNRFAVSQTGNSVGATQGPSSSYGLPRNQNWQEAADRAMSRMETSIAALGDAKGVRFTNDAEHADDVEYVHGYAPFTTMRSRLPEIVDRAAARAKAT